MKILLLFSFILLIVPLSAQAVLIHSHNDYQKLEPLTHALKHQAHYIEADVYLVMDKLVVAHNTIDLVGAPTLDDLYLMPIVSLFKQHELRISEDQNYSPALVIDIKKNAASVLKSLIEKLSQYPDVFDPSRNKNAIQIVISGDRGPSINWSSYPAYLLFDGRPYETYDEKALNRLAMISDSYGNYTSSSDNTDTKIKEVANKVHRQNKLLRLWAIPDNPTSWEHLRKLGVDIINTDKVEECRGYFGR